MEWCSSILKMNWLLIYVSSSVVNDMSIQCVVLWLCQFDVLWVISRLLNISYDRIVNIVLWLSCNMCVLICLLNRMFDVSVSVSSMKLVLIRWNSSFLSVSSGGSVLSQFVIQFVELLCLLFFSDCRWCLIISIRIVCSVVIVNSLQVMFVIRKCSLNSGVVV